MRQSEPRVRGPLDLDVHKMIEKEISKRSSAFGLMVLGTVMAIIPIFLVNILGPFPEGSIGSYSFLAVMFAGLGLQFIFWFKALFHWSQAKGYSGGLAAIGVVGFPIAPLILALLKDKMPYPESQTDPWRSCPNCNAKYRLGDYLPDAPYIFCSACKTELPKSSCCDNEDVNNPRH